MILTRSKSARNIIKSKLQIFQPWTPQVVQQTEVSYSKQLLISYFIYFLCSSSICYNQPSISNVHFLSWPQLNKLKETIIYIKVLFNSNMINSTFLISFPFLFNIYSSKIVSCFMIFLLKLAHARGWPWLKCLVRLGACQWEHVWLAARDAPRLWRFLL